MAKVNLKDVISNEVPPRLNDKYIVRGKKAEFKHSAGSGNPMIQWTCEIAYPLEIERDGKNYSLDGQEFTYFLMLTDKGLRDVRKIHERLELPLEIDTENPDCSIYENLEFAAILNSQEDIPQKVKMDDAGVPVLDDKGKKIYEAVVDENGKPISRGWKITAYAGDILGRASSGIEKKF